MGTLKGMTALGLTIFATTGCVTNVTDADGAKVKYQNLQLSSSAQTVLKTGALPTDKDSKIYPDAIFIYNAYQSSEGKHAREVQIATLAALIFNSDRMCEEYMVSTLNLTKSTASTFDVSSLLFSSWASVTDVQTDAKVLASLSSFASGTRGRLTENVLNKSTPDLIYSATMAYRDKERASLITMLGLAAKDDTISISTISAKINAYHNACGLAVGISQLSASVNESAKKADETGTKQGQTLVKSFQ